MKGLTFKEFSLLAETIDNFLKTSTKAMASKYKMDEEVIEAYRKELKASKGWLFEPSEEELIMTDFKVEKDNKTPIAPKGFVISSFKTLRDGTIGDCWYKADESKQLTNSLNEDEIITVIKSLYNNPKPYKTHNTKENTLKDKCMLILNFSDYHLNKMAFDDNKTIEDRCVDYIRLIKETIYKAKGLYNIEKITYVLGSDFFHTEALSNSTSKGTSQDLNTSPDKAFKRGIELITEVIDYLLTEVPNIHILSLPGNHSRGTEYFFGETIKAYYRMFNNISFDVDFDYRKVITYGVFSAMFNHGDGKPNLIADSFSAYYPQEYLNKDIHIFTGDKHNLQVFEYGRITFRQLGALCGKDKWTSSSNYTSTPRCTTHIIDFKQGRIGEIELKLN